MAIQSSVGKLDILKWGEITTGGYGKIKLPTLLQNIYKFLLTELPENESYSGDGDDHTSNIL